ncbi:hypothetical protein PHMEG_0007458 [Phytophthora megakarya]|uniref:Retrotransposon gag domain-containing protein n=1 Tax=Phytophthora megakarya TaxID=4795 RepID=A0A225WN66_9STRA|nr:hypothetical protein PHMEG_0007458 [Phytophthora megakarya]
MSQRTFLTPNEGYLEEKAHIAELSEYAVVSACHSTGVRTLACNLTEELEEVAGPEPANDSDDKGLTGGTRSKATGKGTTRASDTIPPINGDTPVANKVLGRTLELMRMKSSWFPMFGPKLVRQAVRFHKHPTSRSGFSALLRAMGCEHQMFPSEASLNDWTAADAGTALLKWKKKLRPAFGIEEIAAGRQVIARQAAGPADPSQVPLPMTPMKQSNGGTEEGVFGSEGTPYMYDSHMVIRRSNDSQERITRETEVWKPTPSTRQDTGRRRTRCYDPRDGLVDSESEVGDCDYLKGDLTEEAESKNSTPRPEIATHLPLGNIKSFAGLHNKSEKSMQWLRAFIYEMKGTHTPPNEWCMTCPTLVPQLPRKARRTWKLLSDAFIKFYCSKFNQSAKARYYSATRGEKEQVRDYLNRLNGYARNAGLQFENRGREAKDHVEHFLDT